MEHFFLRLCESTHPNFRQHFIQTITRYLRDPIHSNKKPHTLKIDYFAIKAYFERNDCSLELYFRPNATEELEEEKASVLTFGDLLHLLTLGQPTLLQKAVMLCKFQRGGGGLDTSTFADRFNFEGWDQIVDAFGTKDWNQWDLRLCPVPIRLIRIKTGVMHVGFLDVDAVAALQQYLDYKQTVQDVFKPSPIFVNNKNKPINKRWIRFSFQSLAKRSEVIKPNDKTKRFGINSDSLQILLKPTLVACGANQEVSEEAMGHKTPDRANKHKTQDIQNMREEHSKASSAINIFSRLNGIVNEINDKL